MTADGVTVSEWDRDTARAICDRCERWDLLDDIAQALSAARAYEREECAKIADTEPVPDEHQPAPIEMLAASPITAAIAGVVATKKCIAERIRARAG